MRPAKKGNFAGAPWICVWQSQAPAGTSKFTGVAGCEAFARTVRVRIMTPAAIAPIRTSRRVGMGFLLWRNLIRCEAISVYRIATGGKVPAEGGSHVRHCASCPGSGSGGDHYNGGVDGGRVGATRSGTAAAARAWVSAR